MNLSLKRFPIVILFTGIIWLSGCSNNGEDSNASGYPIHQVPFTSVHLEDQFWSPRIKKNHEVTIPIAIEQSSITGRIKNFAIAGGEAKGSFCSEYPFDDSDVFKIIEAASYSLSMFPDPTLEAKIDSIIKIIGEAQEEDGYLFTNRTIALMNGEDTHPWVGHERWEKVNDLSHELYNLGHLFEAAVAHNQATGKTELLDIAVKAADLLVETFGWGKLEDYPGHEVVELGLVKLSLQTGDTRYLDLAKFFLDVRGPNGPEYCQAHAKVVDQREAVGHSVRATYLYTGMADVAALYDDDSYITAIQSIWEDMVYHKTYITGGIGSGGGNEGFSGPYVLPNMSAYCETCASVGNIIWNYRMFLHDGDAKYMDVLERTLYNAFLSGVSLSGDRFFYPNPLESMGQHKRSRWFGCACCPPNVARLLPSLPGFFYATDGNKLYVNLYAESKAEVDLGDNKVEVIQETNYPWDGTVNITLHPSEVARVEMMFRVPGWSRNQAIPGDLYHFDKQDNNPVLFYVNGKEVRPVIKNGYAGITRKWKEGDSVRIELPMVPRVVLADEHILEDRGKMALQRGPLVYAAEWPDVPEGKVLNLLLDREVEPGTTFRPELLNGVVTLDMEALLVKEKDGKIEPASDTREVRMIPYYSWNNRGPGEMAVWLPYKLENALPLREPTIASKSKVTSSTSGIALYAINDLLYPSYSNDHHWPYLHWWPKRNSTEWLQYTFEAPGTVSTAEVYWFDDLDAGGGCGIPESWRLLYRDGKGWKDVIAHGDYPVQKDSWCSISFDPVTTDAMRLEVKIPADCSAGIHEWIVK